MRGSDTAAHTPSSMPTTNRPLNAGSSMNDDASRLDGVLKVTGRAKYGRDVYPKDALFCAFIRCPWGNADLASSDAQAAKAVPGVVEVELKKDGGTYHGQDVGYIVADSPHALKRGLRALQDQWKRKAVKTLVTDDLGDDESIPDEAKDAIEKGELKLDAVYATPVQTHCSLETHGGVVDHKGDSATFYSSTQGTSASKDGIEKALDLPQSAIEVVCEFVGAGFGSKLNGPGKEGQLAARVASKHKKPAYCFLSRKEDQLDTGNRPSFRAHVRLGFNKDGTITGGHIRSWGGTGVGGGGGGSVPSGRYALGNIKRDHRDVKFNAGGPRPFRAPGSPQGAYVEELMLEEIAVLAGLDPLDLRMKLARSEDHREMMRMGAALIGWKDRQKTGSQTGVLRRGMGLGLASWHRGLAGAEAEVVIHRDGSVEAKTGTQDPGTGQRTVMGIVAATTLGVPLRYVNVRIGRSTLPGGPASGGSVVAHSTAPAMAAAAEDAQKKLLEAVAKAANADAPGLSVKDGRIMQGDKPLMTWEEACGKIAGDSVSGRGRSDRNSDPGTGNSEGAQFVDLTVDTETGVVRVKRVVAIQACGRVVSRKGAESQIIGGVIQGISYALFENRILDRNTGAMVNPNMEMYKILGPADMPHIEPVLYTKGQGAGGDPTKMAVCAMGEPPTVPTAGAVACALFNALGRPVREAPFTPDKVLAALRAP